MTRSVSFCMWSFTLLATACWSGSGIAQMPTNWDGLSQVRAKNVDYLYLRPGADFRKYRGVVLDSPQVAFRKGWQRDVNRSRFGGSPISDTDVRRAIDEAQGNLSRIFEKRLRTAGFNIVHEPAEDAMRVSVVVANVNVSAPERATSGMSRVYSSQAGQATLIVEVRDTLSGELLGRAVDHGVAGDHLMTLRNSVANWADFDQLFDEWASITANGLRRLIDSSASTAR